MEPDMFEITKHLATEESTLIFCRDHGLIPAADLTPDGRMMEFWAVCGEVGFNPAKPDCDGNITTVMRCFKNGPKPQYRCVRCRKQLSQLHGTGPVTPGGRQGATWFASLDATGRPNVKVSKAAVLWCVYCMASGLSVKATLRQGHRRFPTLHESTVIDRRNCVRELFVQKLENSAPMGGPGEVVQIDESLFQGRRKYSRGRALLGDAQRKEEPWVLGMLWVRTGEFRLVQVALRDAVTLTPIICRHVAAGSEIHSNERAAYQRLDAAVGPNGPMAYFHRTINHQLQDVDPVTDVHTKNVECEFTRAKLHLMRLRRGTCPALLPGNLARVWWESLDRRGDRPFLRVLELIRNQ